jgi:peptidoglycan/xylan/chitin deacetylase (PgdA/CDA1 family)
LPEPSDRDALREVRDHLDEAHAAADRLVREAQRQAEEASGSPREAVPPRGWASPGGEASAAPDLQALLALLAAVRDAVPPELSRQLAESLRQLLLALRALLDWYIERLGEPAPGRARIEVEDIPLD